MVPQDLLQPSVSIGSLVINEPVTMLSDFLISLICLISFFRIKAEHFSARNNLYVLAFFYFMFFSTFWGGLAGHGLQYYLSPAWKIPSWLSGMLAVVSFQLIAAKQIKELKPGFLFQGLIFLNLLSFLTTIYLVFVLRVFVWVQFHAVLGILFVVLPIQVHLYRRTASLSSKKIMYGISFAILAALVHMLFLGFNKWFNHADISHVLLAISNWFFYVGLRSLLSVESEREINFAT
jgi:hypothetical protein